MTIDPRRHAAVLWPVLADLALRRSTTTYGQLAPQVGLFHRNLNRPLDVIARQCKRMGVPPLSVVVVNADTGRPGDGFLDSDDVEGEFSRVYAHDWSREVNPFGVFLLP